MRVNDSPNHQDMMGNCALCTIAGLIGSTAEGVRARVRHSTDHDTDADMAFAHYALRHGVPKTTTLATQMKGVKLFLRNECGLTVTQIVRNPLTEGEALRQIVAYPDGAMFAVLVVRGSMSAAHWLAARKDAGRVQFVDYQLDAPSGKPLIMLKRVQKQRENNLFGAPHVTDGPRRAWGTAVAGSDRFIVLGITRGERQNTAVAAIGTAPSAGGDLAAGAGVVSHAG